MFTANTMSSVVEALGMALPGTCSAPAVTRENVVTDKKKAQCVAVVDQLFNLLCMKEKITTRQIMTRKVMTIFLLILFALLLLFGTGI